MKLYIANHTCSLAAQIIAHEVGLPVEIHHVDVKTKTFAGNDYLAINRYGYVPVLQFDDGATLSETAAVTQFLAETKPELNLMPPAGSFERAKLIELQIFIATEIHQKFIPVFRDYVPEEAKDKFRQILITNFASLDERFADGRTYLTGETFTVADAYLFSVIPWTERTHVDISQLKRLWAFQARVAARPAVQEALRDEAKAAAGLPV